MSHVLHLIGANFATLLGGEILGVSAAGLGATVAGLTFTKVAQGVAAMSGIILTGLVVRNRHA